MPGFDPWFGYGLTTMLPLTSISPEIAPIGAVVGHALSLNPLSLYISGDTPNMGSPLSCTSKDRIPIVSLGILVCLTVQTILALLEVLEVSDTSMHNTGPLLTPEVVSCTTYPAKDGFLVLTVVGFSCAAN